MNNALKNLAAFLALRRNTTLLLAALVLAGTGERLWLGFAPKYLETLGAGVFLIGLFDGLQTLLGALYNYPGGWLTDRWGQRRSLLAFSALSLGGYLLVLAWPHWLALLLGVFLFVAWGALSLPTTFAVVATSLQRRQHTMGIGVQSLVRRVPMLVGPVLGGWLVTRHGWAEGMRHALALCVGLSLLTIAFQWFLVEAGRDHAQQSPNACNDGAHHSRAVSGVSAVSFWTVVRSFSPALRELLISDILIRFCERIPYAFVILWAINHAGVSAQQFGYLVAFEMATAMVCYIPVAHLADRHGQRPFVLATFVFFTLFPVALLVARDFAWLTVAFVVRGLKEFGEPARKAMIIGEATAQWPGRTYGAYYLIRDCVVTSGSFLGAWLWSISPETNFLGAAVCGAAGTVWFWRCAGRGARRQAAGRAEERR